MTHGDPFFGWRGYIELALTRRMEADGMVVAGFGGANDA